MISRPSGRRMNATGPRLCGALWDTVKIHKGGFYHDGRFMTLVEVVEHYDKHFGLNLNESEAINLIEYLKSL